MYRVIHHSPHLYLRAILLHCTALALHWHCMNQLSQHVNILITQPQNSVVTPCNCTINQGPQSTTGFLESVHHLELQTQHSISKNGSSSPYTNTKTCSSLHMQRLAVSTNCVPFGMLGYVQHSRQEPGEHSHRFHSVQCQINLFSKNIHPSSGSYPVSHSMFTESRIFPCR
jgi:hypothetical protein